jgi:hypothetical protein
MNEASVAFLWFYPSFGDKIKDFSWKKIPNKDYAKGVVLYENF